MLSQVLPSRLSSALPITHQDALELALACQLPYISRSANAVLWFSSRSGPLVSGEVRHPH